MDTTSRRWPEMNTCFGTSNESAATHLKYSTSWYLWDGTLPWGLTDDHEQYVYYNGVSTTYWHDRYESWCYVNVWGGG